MTNLCIDIGNTFYKASIFREDKEIFVWKSKKLLIRDIKEWKSKYKFEHVILSSTRNANTRIESHLTKNYSFIKLDHLTKLPVKNKYKTPQTLGRDRIAGVVGAWTLFPKTNNLVIDAGTCITFDFINAKGHYLGGNISPGILLRLKSMNAFTDKLPLGSATFHRDYIGKTTITAIENGAMWGTIGEIEAFIRRIQGKYGEINVILTGGDASIFAQKIKTKIFVFPNLLMIGLNEIIRYNAAKL